MVWAGRQDLRQVEGELSMGLPNGDVWVQDDRLQSKLENE